MQVKKQQLKLDMEQHTVRQGCMLSPCLFNLYAKYITRNAGLDEAQTGIRIAWRNINHLRYADDTTFMEESEEELKSLLLKMKEESEKVGFVHIPIEFLWGLVQLIPHTFSFFHLDRNTPISIYSFIALHF